jgi:DNA gyrase/topoisomerase IV subunit B
MATENDIKATRIHDAIRMRPAMYIGQVGSSGLSHLLGDLLLEGAIRFKASDICIHLNRPGTVSFAFRKAEINEQELGGTISGKLRSGHEFGLLSLVTAIALSTSFSLIVARKKHKVNANGIIRPGFRSREDKCLKEVTLVFTPDKKIFGSTGPEGLMFYQLMSAVAFTMPSVRIILQTDYTKPFSRIVVHCPNGMQHLLDLEAARCSGRNFEQCFRFEKGGIRGQVGWFYSRRYGSPPQSMSFANGKSTTLGGSHVTGVIEGIHQVVQEHIKHQDPECKVDIHSISDGLCLAISIWGEGFRYGGSTKDYLEQESVQQLVRDVVKDHLANWLTAEHDEAKKFLRLFMSPEDHMKEMIEKLISRTGEI